MMRVMVDGQLDERIAGDPRLSRSQLDAIRKAGEADSKACVLGLDVNMHPVIQARMPTSRHPTAWSVLRNGSSKPPPRRRDRTIRLAEPWDSPPEGGGDVAA